MDNKVFKVNLTALNELQCSGEEVSYKILCEKIGLKRAEGNQKIKQLKDLGRICAFEKIGSKYLIKEVFEQIDEIKLEHGNNIFDQYIECILMSLFRNDPAPKYVTNSKLITYLYMVNSEFREVRTDEDKKRDKARSYHCVIPNLDKALTVISNNLLGRWARTSLQRLSKKGYFSVTPSYQYSTSILDSSRENKTRRIYFTHNVVPNSETYKLIEQASKATLAEMGLLSKRMGPDKRIIYYQNLSEKVRNQIDTHGETLESVWDCIIIEPVANDSISVSVSLSESISAINSEAVRKCETSKQLDFLTGTARKNIVRGLILNSYLFQQGESE